eukprot:494304-Alexandrium_andersonii.AAC.1
MRATLTRRWPPSTAGAERRGVGWSLPRLRAWVPGKVALETDDEEANDALRTRVRGLCPGLALEQMPPVRARESKGIIESARK